MTATRSMIYSGLKRRYIEIEVAGIKDKVRLQSLSARECSQLEASSVDDKGNASKWLMSLYDARWVVACVVDESGDRVFSDSDVEEVGAQDSFVIDVIAAAARNHCNSGIQTVQELEKNLPGTTAA